MCVFIPAHATSRVGIHTIFVLFVWERSMHSQRSRALAVYFVNSVHYGRSAAAWHSLQRVLRLAFPRMWVPLLPRQSKSWGSQMNLSEGLDMGLALFLPSPDRSSAFSQCSEAHFAIPSALSEAPVLQVSSSEELEIESIEAGEVDDLPPHSPTND